MVTRRSMRSEVLDDFSDVSDWMPVASGLAELHISSEPTGDGAVMRLDFDFKGGGGFRWSPARSVDRPLPESYALSFAVRGAAPANRFELKLEDVSRGATSGGVTGRRSTSPADWAARSTSATARSSSPGGPDGPWKGWRALGALGARRRRRNPAGRGDGVDRRLAARGPQLPRARPSSPRRAPRAGHPPEKRPSTATRRRAGRSARGRPDRIDSRSTSGKRASSAGSSIEWARNRRRRRRTTASGEPLRSGFRVDTSGDGPSRGRPRSRPRRPKSSGASCRCRTRARASSHSSWRATTAGACGIAELAVQPLEFSRSLEAFLRARPRATRAARTLSALARRRGHVLDARRAAGRRHVRPS